ncbi:hypothetical protein JCM5353_000502 [Sporobolomyces roseus]
MSSLLEDPQYDFPEEYVPDDTSLGNIYRRFTMVATALAIFDTLATFPLEYKYIWKGERTLLMFLFLMNRWGSLLMQIMTTLLDFAIFSDVQCHQLYWFNALGGVWIAFLVFMLLCLLGMTIGPTYQLRAALPPRELVNYLHIPGCEAEVSGKLSGGQEELFFATVLVFDAIVLGLTLYRTIVISKVAGRLPILQKLQRDGIWYYGVITVTNLVSLIFVVLTSLMCSRLVFSLFESANNFASNKGGSSNGVTKGNKSPATVRGTVPVNRRSLIVQAERFVLEDESGVAMHNLSSRHSNDIQDSTGDLHFAPGHSHTSSGTPGVHVQRETHVEVN